MSTSLQCFLINFLFACAIVIPTVCSSSGPALTDQDDQATMPTHHSPLRDARSPNSLLPRSGHAPPNPNAIQCGNGFGKFDVGDDRSISCENYGGVKYTCIKRDCHVGYKMEPISRENSVRRNLIFWSCNKYMGKFGDNHKIDWNTNYLVRAERFWPDNDKGQMAVLGRDARIHGSIIEGFRCDWTTPNSFNNVRPWCNTCSLWKDK